MRIYRTLGGFPGVEHQKYAAEEGEMANLVEQSTMIGDYEDGLSCPGSSCLWIGSDHHLNREEVAKLVKRLQHWLDHGTLRLGHKRR